MANFKAQLFWRIHDELFKHQAEITEANVKARLEEFAGNARDADLTAYKACLANELSLGLVFRDMNLATTNAVEGTPTLFIYGRRVPGVAGVDQLRQIIANAKTKSAQASPNTSAASRDGQLEVR